MPPLQARFWTFAVEQARPQAPQLSGSEPTLASQPSSASGEGGWEQLSKFVLQVESQRPFVQLRSCTFELEHALSHVPQWSTSLLNVASQPSSSAGALGWPQLPKPAWQLDVQRPPAQLAVATLVSEQARPQPPQCCKSSETSFSQPSSAVGAGGCEQFPKPLWQLESHRPALQDRAAVLTSEQPWAQSPQCCASVNKFVSQPSSTAGTAGCAQLPRPTWQVDVHRPPAQIAVTTPASATSQVRPHAPQWRGCMRRLTSQPLAGLPSQSA
jgi:hypothetical protein